MIRPSLTFTSPRPAKSVTFQPARVLPSKRLFHSTALAESGGAAGFGLAVFSGAGLSAAVARPANPQMSHGPKTMRIKGTRRRAAGLGERRFIPGLALRQNFLHQFPVHIGQPIVAALETEGEFLVVEAQAMENGRVQIVDVNPVP